MPDSSAVCCLPAAPLSPSCCWCSWRTEEDGHIVSARQHTACPNAGKNSPRLCSPPPLAAAPATAPAKNNIWTWQQMSLKQARGGRDGTARGTFGSGRLLGGGGGRVWGGLQTMWFMRTLEGEHEDYLDSAGRLIYGEVPL